VKVLWGSRTQNTRGMVRQKEWAWEDDAEVMIRKMNKLGPNSFDFKHQLPISSKKADARAEEAEIRSTHW